MNWPVIQKTALHLVFQYEETHFDNINLFYFYMYFSDRMSAEKKIKKWQCFGNGYLMAPCPHTKGQMADMTFIEVMLDRQFSDNKILK